MREDGEGETDRKDTWEGEVHGGRGRGRGEGKGRREGTADDAGRGTGRSDGPARNARRRRGRASVPLVGPWRGTPGMGAAAVKRGPDVSPFSVPDTEIGQTIRRNAFNVRSRVASDGRNATLIPTAMSYSSSASFSCFGMRLGTSLPCAA